MPDQISSLRARLRAYSDDWLIKTVKWRFPSLASPNDFLFDRLMARRIPSSFNAARMAPPETFFKNGLRKAESGRF